MRVAGIAASVASVVAGSIACCLFAGDAEADGPVRVFVLAGQSNMEGFGHLRTLPHLASLPRGDELLDRLRAPDGSWRVRDDVFVFARDGAAVGPLTVGFGASQAFVGPELAFGTVVGEAFEEPVLLIKTAWGGKDLHFDFRPPSAGPLPYPIDPVALAERGGEAAIGACYRRMVAEVKDCLSRMDELFPALAGRTPEIEGLVWFQGWNEMFPAKGCDFEEVVADYPALYAALVRDLERDLGVGALPSVVGELGVNGGHASERIVKVRRRQAEIAAVPALAGAVRVVATAPLWDPALDAMQERERAVRRSARERVAPAVEAELAERLAEAPEPERRRMRDEAIRRAVEQTDEYQAWQREWETIAGHWECHYWGSAPVYCMIGAGLGEAMRELLAARPAR